MATELRVLNRREWTRTAGFGLAMLAWGFGGELSAYEQNGQFLAHQWFGEQARLFYHGQFGVSEIDQFVGAVQQFPAAGNNDRFLEGIQDEDANGENPFGDTQPFLRHFWAHDAQFQRVFDDGLGAANSAPNRAVEYFRGGLGLTGMMNNDWGMAQGAQQGSGIVQQYQDGNIGRAYYWLGSAAHLLQDLSLPCHSHNDAHPLTFDQDPMHDWIDGRAFAVNDGAAFNDNTVNRYMRWAFNAQQGGVGRGNNLDTSPLRSFQQLANMQLQAEWQASVPAGVDPQSLPLYHLFLETAGLADDFDSRDVNGQDDGGARRNNGGAYNNWTMAELDAVADIIAPLAMVATAELFRYFYSLVDTTAADVAPQGFSEDPENPTISSETSVTLRATGSDATSGVDLDGYLFLIDRFDGNDWESLLTTGPGLPERTLDFEQGTYRLRVHVENGAGLIGISEYGYVNVVPEPGVCSLIVLTLAAFGPGARWRRR